MNLREATSHDIPAITTLTNLAYRVEDFFINGNRTFETEVERLLAEHTFLVADNPDGTLAASVFLRITPPRGYFGMLSVDPALQRAGRGRLLIEAAEQRALFAGCTAMDLTVVHLRTELLPYYRSLGYIETGTEPFPDPHKLTQPAHMIAMSKLLGVLGKTNSKTNIPQEVAP